MEWNGNNPCFFFLFQNNSFYHGPNYYFFFSYFSGCTTCRACCTRGTSRSGVHPSSIVYSRKMIFYKKIIFIFDQKICSSFSSSFVSEKVIFCFRSTWRKIASIVCDNFFDDTNQFVMRKKNFFIYLFFFQHSILVKSKLS